MSEQQIKLVILDVDGVMTDGTKTYDTSGKVISKRFCDKDWTAIKKFKALGIDVLCLTGDPFNEAILKNRRVDCIVTGKQNKIDFLDEICRKKRAKLSEICYLGDDIFDFEIMMRIDSKDGYSYTVLDAAPELLEYFDTIEASGGQNAVSKLYEKLDEDSLIYTPPLNNNVVTKKFLEKVYKIDKNEQY